MGSENTLRAHTPDTNLKSKINLNPGSASQMQFFDGMDNKQKMKLLKTERINFIGGQVNNTFLGGTPQRLGSQNNQ